MSAESPRHARSGGPLLVPSQPPSDRTLIDAVSGFINDVTLSSSSNIDPKDVIQWARFESADINEPISEGDTDNDISPLLLILGYGSGVQVWLVPPTGEAQEVLSWRQGTVRVLRVLPTPQHNECFAAKRPLIALCDSASPGPSFCSLSFISIRGGEQVKSIKFKNQILDVLANKRSIVVAFSERFAVFDASTLEDRMAVTTCYPCPDPLGGSVPINPLTLGDRWLAYADKKLNPSKRSSGGCEGEGVTSYTATVLHAAKSLSKGLRGLGESVAHSLAGGRGTSQSPSPPNADIQQPGIVTVIDIEGSDEEDGQETEENYDPIVAHFIAHSEAIIALKFDASGMLLVTADRRGHDFHVFRINPHPCGPSLASVHHLYILHRGDTTAKVQDIAISPDSRWCAVSTLRGTTHMFPISAYGGACGVRTHTQPRVVNRLSRFHRSAGLPIHACAPNRSGSPVGDGLAQGAWFPNPRLPPYPLPTTVTPLAQLRPTANLPTHTITRTSSGRQRLSSTSEDSSCAPLLARARLCCASVPVSANNPRAPAALSLYLLSASGSLMHLVLHPKPAQNVPKEKICDESPIELEVEPIAQWPLQRPSVASDLLAPLPPSNPLLHHITRRRCSDVYMSEEERWLSQVEIVTHAGPHRRLWMGPQFVFKTYNHSGSSSSLSEAETVEVETSRSSVARSNPVNMPCVRPLVPVLIDSGSASSLEHSPSDSFRRKSLLAESGRAPSVCDVQLREDLAEAMKEDHGWRREERREAPRVGIARVVDPLGTVVTGSGRGRDDDSSSSQDDADLYLHSNADEATFRPVVRAAAALSVQPDMIVRPLPRDTTIPVQTLPVHTLSPTVEPMALKTEVVIPVALNGKCWTAPDRVADATSQVTKPSETMKQQPHSTEIDEKKPASIFATKVDSKILDVKDNSVNKDLKRESDECERETSDRGSTKKVEREIDVNSLPKLIQPSDDIQPPVVRPRVKKSPTSKSVTDSISVSIKTKNKESEARIEIANPKGDENASKETKQTKYKLKKENQSMPAETKQPTDQPETSEVKITKFTENKINNDVEKSLTKDKKLKKYDILDIKQNVEDKVPDQTINDNVKITGTSKTENKIIKVIDDFYDLSFTNDDKCEKSIAKRSQFKMESSELECAQKQPSVKVTLPLPIKKEKNRRHYDDIKTEEQAWDMLLNEPAKLSDNGSTVKVKEDAKPKTRRNRKKAHEDSLTGTDDDSFIEIHQIEEKQTSCGDLVSISTVEEASSFYAAKTKKSRSPKNSLKTDDTSKFDSNWSNSKLNSSKNMDALEPLFVASNFETEHKIHPDGTSSETTSYISSVPKSKKSKSLSPYPENRKQNEKDVYVIDTAKEEFPDIKITKGNRTNRKYEKPIESKIESETIAVTEKPPISWSSIAASKSGKKNDEIKLDSLEPTSKIKENYSKEEGHSSTFSEVSLQDKLFEICKRTDIMVAECDKPTELKFVEEHHSVLTDLPPLEPLDFVIDDFKLEVMKDSLLDVNETKITSPICKINIDDILSSIKETTSKVIESSMFNLVDLEKVPAKMEKGFKIVENDKITTQEIKVDDEVKSDADGMEKSSDDDMTSPVTSTDSDKEEKKNNGATNLVLPSKQSAKSKKSRRKRK